ncbi:DUF4136 domain-containing protein [Ketobacter sp.]|uniref:DUF4136 domain-containing protein n=1 Tax=Ketobacter sp. TaxID=2083498 RepID=UPI0025BE8C36|nr:DUF4136 domain-containing protein [Ketobacter sp.]
MFRLIWVGIAVAVTLLTGCAQKLANYDYDPKFNFTGYQRYALQQSDKQTYQSLDSSRIEAAIKQQLSGRYQLVEPAQADFVMHYYLQAEHKVDQSGVSFGFGVGVASNVGVGVSTSPPAKQKTEGQLVLEAVDSASQQMVWVAKGTRNLKDSMNPTQRDYLVNDVVQEMLANFPPK